MRPDVGIAPVPAYNKLNALFLRTLGCGEVYGVNTGEGIEKLLLTHISNVNRENHVALQTIQALNSDIRSIDPSWYPVMNQERIKLYQFGQKGKARLIVEVSNHRPTSQLANEKLANILNDLSKRIDFTVVITLRPGYEETAKKLSGQLQMPNEICLTPSLDDFISLVNGCDVFLFGDGGAAHIAGALGKRGVALYGITSVEKWKVLSDKVIHIYHERDVNEIQDQKIKQSLSSVFELL